MKKKSKNIKDIKSYIERYMNEDKNLCKFEIECIMKRYFNSSIYYAFAFDYEENLIIITLDNEDISTTNNLHISSFGDGLIFDILQNVFIKIEYMSFYMHYELWKEIDDKFLNIEKWRGMNKYLKYCMDNYIDKEINIYKEKSENEEFHKKLENIRNIINTYIDRRCENVR